MMVLALADSYAGVSFQLAIEDSTPTMPVEVSNNTSDTKSFGFAGEYAHRLDGPLWVHSMLGASRIVTPALDIFNDGPAAQGEELELGGGVELRGCVGQRHNVCGFVGEDLRGRLVHWSSGAVPDDGRHDLVGATRFGGELALTDATAFRVSTELLQQLAGTDGTHLSAGVLLTMGLVHAWK